MKRRIGALWIATLYAAVSCARGSNLEGVGGSATSTGGATAGAGAPAAGSGGSPTGSVSSGVGGSPATTASSTSAVGASSSATTAVSSSSSATTAVGSSSSSASSSGGSLDAGLDAAADGGTGFGPCVTQQDIDGQSTQPFEIGFCHNPFACILCPNNAVNPGDIVCSPNCLCAPLPPRCGSDAGAD